jgi:hypothetical protein
MIRLISATQQIQTEDLWIAHGDLHALTGWVLKPEGLCKDEACVPLPAELSEKAIDGARVEASVLWRGLGRPLLHDAAHETWMLGEAAQDRARQLDSLEAPDFSLPDLDGKLHRLSDHRGTKVLLATWASW